MKKLILFLILAFVLTLLVMLNYLLWDRENQARNIKDLSSSKSESVETLNARISILEQEIQRQKEEITNITLELDNEKKNSSYLKAENQNFKQKVIENEKILEALERQVDNRSFENTITQWAANISKGNYIKSYQLQLAKYDDNAVASNYDDFLAQYGNKISEIKVKAIEPYNQSDYRIDPGSIAYLVHLDVTLKKGQTSELFTEGPNDVIFRMDYLGYYYETWLISGILSKD